MKVFNKTCRVIGKTIVLRPATPEDAGFVLAMRSDTAKTTFLNKINGSVDDQRRWLERCYADPHQIYFVICSKSDEPLGLVRIYDQRGESFCWGSWLIKHDAPPTTAIESALLIYKYALDVVGFKRSHFDVRIGNDRVIAFHERFGASEVKRDQLNIFFEIDGETIRKSLERFRKYLP